MTSSTPPPRKTMTGSQLASELAQQIRGKVILTTGVSPGGLGEQFVKTVSIYEPKLLILAGRNQSKLQETQQKLLGGAENSRILVLDLSSQAQIRQAAKEVLDYSESIDVIVNNAGIMATPYSKTGDGIEMQFGCNHIGHFLFTNLIMSKLSSRVRIINVSSDGYRLGPVRFQDYNFQDGQVYNRWRAYGQSKTANMLFSKALAKRLSKSSSSSSRGITSYSLHPGVIKTNLSSLLEMSDFEELIKIDKEDGHLPDPNGFTYLSLDEGTATHIYAAFHPDLSHSSSDRNGGYLESCRVFEAREIHSWARDDVEADMLWELSEKLVGQTFKYD